VHSDFVGAEHRDFEPTELPSRQGGKFSVKVLGYRENAAGYILAVDAVETDHQRQQLASFVQDLVARIGLNSRCTTYTATTHQPHLDE
jgi:hypothetical protein